MPIAPDRIRLALDVTPMIGPVTGVGQVVAEVVHGLAGRTDVELRPLVLSWRGRHGLQAVLAASAATTGPVAARPTALGGTPPALPPLASSPGPLQRLGSLPAALRRPWPLPARPSRWAWSHVDHPTVALATGPVDVVHGLNFVVPPGGGATELVTVHDLTAWHHPDLVHPSSLAYPRLLERAVRRGAHVHVVSAFVGDEVRQVTGLPAERVHVVPNGCRPLPPGDPVRGREIAGAEAYVLAVGTVEPRKDYPALVEALASLRPEHPELHLVIAGGAGWGSDALDGAIARTGTERRVRRLGYVDERTKADLLAGSRALAYPSRYEGFGLVPLEAMAAGVPVVATAAGAIPEVVGDAAELCPVGDPAALAAALDRVLGDPDHAARLVAAGRQRVLTFSWERAVDELVVLYRRLAAWSGEVRARR